MKNPFLIISIFLATVSSTLFAQVDFFPPGAEWYYGFDAPGLLQVKGYTHFKYSGDTTLAAGNAKIIQRTIYYFDYNNPTIPIDTVVWSPVYMSQSEDSIFYYTGGAFQFLWKMDVQSGDSFEVIDDIFTYTMNIDSVATVLYGFQDVKKIWLSGGTGTGQDGSVIIYDQFGPTNGFDYYNCWGFYDCYDATLCRYQSDAMGRIDFSSQVCDLLSTSTKPVQVITAVVFPNPFDEVFSVEMGSQTAAEVRIELYTLTGQLVYAKNFHTGETVKVDLTGQGDGMYVGKAMSGRVNRVFRVVKE